jgi:hypothetical protein
VVDIRVVHLLQYFSEVQGDMYTAVGSQLHAGTRWMTLCKGVSERMMGGVRRWLEREDLGGLWACLLDFTAVCLSRPYLNHHLLISKRNIQHRQADTIDAHPMAHRRTLPV